MGCIGGKAAHRVDREVLDAPLTWQPSKSRSGMLVAKMEDWVSSYITMGYGV